MIIKILLHYISSTETSINQKDNEYQLRDISAELLA